MVKRGDVLVDLNGALLYVEAVRTACIWPDRAVVLRVARVYDIKTGEEQTDLPLEQTTTLSDADVDIMWAVDAKTVRLRSVWRGDIHGLPVHPIVAKKIQTRLSK